MSAPATPPRPPRGRGHSRQPSFSKRLQEVLAEARTPPADAGEQRAAPGGAGARAWGHLKFVCVILWKAIPRALPKVLAALDLLACAALFFVAELDGAHARRRPLKPVRHELRHYRFTNALSDVEVAALLRALHALLSAAPPPDVRSPLHTHLSRYSLAAYGAGAASLALFLVKVRDGGGASRPGGRLRPASAPCSRANLVSGNAQGGLRPPCTPPRRRPRRRP